MLLYFEKLLKYSLKVGIAFENFIFFSKIKTQPTAVQKIYFKNYEHEIDPYCCILLRRQ